MKSRKFLGVIVAVAMIAAGAAQAGTKRLVPVTVDVTRSTASGSLGGARASTDANQSIGCAMNAVSSITASCTARDAAGVTRTCVTSVAQHLQVIATLQSDSYLSFTWDASGACTRIAITNDSTYFPKSP